MNKKTIRDVDVRGKRVLVRVDFNVPLDEGKVADDTRIQAALPTIRYLLDRHATLILCSHLGRPKGQVDDSLKMDPVAERLAELLEQPVTKLDDCVGPAVESAVRQAGSGEVMLLENTRFHPEEKANDPEFARQLARLADLYVNDAFGSYRAHVSTYDVARLLPAYAGALLQKELKNLHKVLNPKRPFIAVIAGAKYDTKIGPLKSLYTQVDHLILGGLMYNTFLSAKYGVDIAGVSKEDRTLAMELVDLDKKERKILELPYLVESDTTEGKNEGHYRTVSIDDFKKGKTVNYLLDMDPRSLEETAVKDAIHSAKTIFVNAVMGLMPSFFEGSQALYRLIAENGSAMKLFGGGDTLQELKNLCPGVYMEGLDAPETYYFTGGGSVLAAIEKGSPYRLQPVEALMEPGSS